MGLRTTDYGLERKEESVLQKVVMVGMVAEVATGDNGGPTRVSVGCSRSSPG